MFNEVDKVKLYLWFALGLLVLVVASLAMWAGSKLLGALGILLFGGGAGTIREYDRVEREATSQKKQIAEQHKREQAVDDRTDDEELLERANEWAEK